MDKEMVDRLHKIRQRIMGGRHGRKPRELPFENHHRAVKVRGGDRCYSLALTVEGPRNTGAPVSSSRMDNSMVLDEHQLMQKELVNVCETLALIGTLIHPFISRLLQRTHVRRSKRKHLIQCVLVFESTQTSLECL